MEPVYGVTQPLTSWSPVWANFAYFGELFERARNRRGWHRIRTFLAPPEWKPARESTEPAPLYVPYNAHPVSPFVNWMAVTCFSAGIALTFVLLALPLEWSLLAKSAIALCAAATAWFSAKLFDGAAEKNRET